MIRNQAKISQMYTKVCKHIPSAGSLLIPLLQESVTWLRVGAPDRPLQYVKPLLCNKVSMFSIYDSVIMLTNAVSHGRRVCLE